MFSSPVIVAFNWGLGNREIQNGSSRFPSFDAFELLEPGMARVLLLEWIQRMQATSLVQVSTVCATDACLCG